MSKAPVRRRPKDRKAQIARASAEAFSELGYHGVRMEDIAARVGISAAALYRHYSGKYELFCEAVLSLGQQLVDATDIAEDSGDPQGDLDQLVAALIDTALANREAGGLYRWEVRYLYGEAQQTLDTQVRTVHQRIHRPLRLLRPELSSRQCWTISTALLSVLGSIVDHRATLAASRIRVVLAEAAAALLTADVPELSTDAAPPKAPEPLPLSKYEALLDESMRQFNERGYRDTTVEDIASAVGLPASGMYRYFSSKSDILAAGFRRAADRLSADIAATIAAEPEPVRALTSLVEVYVARSFDSPELDYVYYTERLNMADADRHILRGMQHDVVQTWADLLVATRDELPTAAAVFVVHAAMSLVVDLGRLLSYRNTTEARRCVCALVELTLLGQERLRTALPARYAT
jgi:AcrR family transcriptional regulator